MAVLNRQDDMVFWPSRSEAYGLPKIKIKKISPKDFGKALYKFSGAQGMVDSGKALAKCKPSDSKCIAKNLAETALAASSFVPGAGVAGKAAMVARTAATAAKAAKAGKAVAAAAKAGKAVASVAGKGAKMAGEAALSAGGSAVDFVGDNAGEIAAGGALLGAGALGAAALSRMGGAGAAESLPPGDAVASAAGGLPLGAMAGAPGFPGAPGAPGAPGGAASVYSPIQMWPPSPPPPIKINIQISGKDMAASSGAFGDEIIGKPSTKTEAEAEDDAEEPGGIDIMGALSKAKSAKDKLKTLKKGRSKFTVGPSADFEPVDQSPNWFLVFFVFTMICVIAFTSK